ncbi:hypothetical protein PV783_21295 [Chitinophaga sp. CC14]|uniref:RHS repeat-associated core domain-containing protein n=1 Tax=Chitinophaga sp. CC14 TaxID=3029199 RepID=UPI003B7F4128
MSAKKEIRELKSKVTLETSQEVFFDNVVVAQASGPLLEETHYYRFGLTMAGISSNALKGSNYPKNRKEFNGIEHTTDLDLNQYDAFYRNLDPQIGKWWQIDSKPNHVESPYASMSNNPIGMVDPLGDTTQYMDHNGNSLYVSNDNLPNALTVTPEQNSGGFALILAFLNTKYGAKYKNNNSLNEVLRKTGKSYSADQYFKLYDEHQDKYNGKDEVPVDGKGPLYKEFKIQVFDDNGDMTARGNSDNDGTPGLSIVDQGDAAATLHTHPNEGRRVRKNSGIGSYGVGESGMETDLWKTTQKPGSGYFNIVVTQGQVRLYNSSGVKIIINRNGHIFKKTKE